MRYPLKEARMRITFKTPDQPAVHELIGELDAYLYALYPAENVYALDIAAPCGARALFAVARDAAGDPICCGGIVITSEYGEVTGVPTMCASALPAPPVVADAFHVNSSLAF